MKISLATAIGTTAAYIKSTAVNTIENDGARELAKGVCTAIEVGCTIAGLFGA